MSLPVLAFGACVDHRPAAVPTHIVKSDSYTGFRVCAPGEIERVIFVGPELTAEISYSDHGTIATDFEVRRANLECLRGIPGTQELTEMAGEPIDILSDA
jgi:hypothetical protein